MGGLITDGVPTSKTWEDERSGLEFAKLSLMLKRSIHRFLLCAVASGQGAVAVAASRCQDFFARARGGDQVREFTASGQTGYVRVYDAAIVHYGGWRQAARLHLASVNRSLGPRVVVDAGGGTGRMTQMAMAEFPQARVELLDLSPDMAKFASANGVPTDRIHISDVTNMKLSSDKTIPDASVDHIISHSVIWLLPEPAAFFREAFRVLRPGGRVSVVTVGALDQLDVRSSFLEGLESDMEHAFSAGQIDVSVRDGFVSANRWFAANAPTTSNLALLASLGKSAGLRPLDTGATVYSGGFLFMTFEK